MENVRLEFTEEALRAVVNIAIKRKTGPADSARSSKTRC